MKLTYRPEIDGLRAIAVSIVILYHAQITILGHQPFRGGFIGVDIFFVISGYLITSIILKELVTTGSFSFKYFYERRIRRILPPLLFVMLASLPFASMYLLPSSLIDFSKSILYSLGFSSNFFFHYSGQQYDAENGLLKPFLHTWSLSVEEQFYILFPIFLLVTFKYFKKYLLIILFFSFVISLQMADFGSKNYPSATFYFLHTRMWELIVGSILAYFEIILGRRGKHKKLNLILPSVGLILIGHSILFFNEKIFHPSFFTLSPIIGVSLIIWFSNGEEIINKILSSRLFTGVGLISYSLYLWHYPIFSFARMIEITQGDFVKKVILGIVVFILSIFTYFFIEKPARNKKFKFRFIFLLLLLFYFILILVNSTIILKDGYHKRVPEIIQKNLSEKPWNLLKNSDEKICFTSFEGCKFNTTSKKKVYAIGDSHIASLTFDLKNRVINRNYQFVTSNIACLYLPEFNLINIKTKKINSLCNDPYFKNLNTILSNETNSILIFGGRFPLYLSNNYFNNEEGGVEGTIWEDKYISNGKYKTIQQSFKNEIHELSKKNKIILVYPIPEAGWNIPQKLNKFFKSLPKNVNNKVLNTSNFITTSFDVYKKRTKVSFELLDSIEGNNIYRIFPHKLFCDKLIKDRCLLHDENNIFYSDDNHPSIKGAEMINDLILKEIEKIEQNYN